MWGQELIRGEASALAVPKVLTREERLRMGSHLTLEQDANLAKALQARLARTSNPNPCARTDTLSPCISARLLRLAESRENETPCTQKALRDPWLRHADNAVLLASLVFSVFSWRENNKRGV